MNKSVSSSKHLPADEEIHLHSGIFAMDLMRKVLEKSRLQSKLTPTACDKLYSTIQYKWQEKLHLSGHLPIPRPIPTEQHLVEDRSISKEIMERRAQDVRLTAVLPPLQRPPGRLHGKPATFLPPIPYHNSQKPHVTVADEVTSTTSSSGKKRGGSHNVAIREDFVLIDEVMPQQQPQDNQIPGRVTRSGKHQSSSSNALAPSNSTAAIGKAEQFDIDMPLSSQQKKKRRATTTLDSRHEEKDETQVNAAEDLIFGMKIVVDPRYYVESRSNSSNAGNDYPNDEMIREGRIVQIYPINMSVNSLLSFASSSQSKFCNLKLREGRTGHEMIVTWPNQYLSIYHPNNRSTAATNSIQSQDAIVIDAPLSKQDMDRITDDNVQDSVMDKPKEYQSVEQIQNALADILGGIDSDYNTLGIDGTSIGCSQGFGAISGDSWNNFTGLSTAAVIGSSYDNRGGFTSGGLFDDDDDDDDAFFNMIGTDPDYMPYESQPTVKFDDTLACVATPAGDSSSATLNKASNIQPSIELCRLTTGESVTEETVDDVEKYFERLRKKKQLNISIKRDPTYSSQEGTVDGTPTLLPDEDPAVPLDEPEVVLIGRLRKIKKPDETWNIDLQDVYVSDKKRKCDLILPVVKLTMDSSRYFYSDNETLNKVTHISS